MPTPDRALTRVDLPAPLSPTSAMICPGATARSTPRSASTEPKLLRMPCICRRGADPERASFSEVTVRCHVACAHLSFGDKPVIKDPGDVRLVDDHGREEQRGHRVPAVVEGVGEAGV